MICPYIQNFSYTEQKNILHEEEDFVETIAIGTIWKNASCLKENCAVWDKKEERCRYNG